MSFCIIFVSVYVRATLSLKNPSFVRNFQIQSEQAQKRESIIFTDTDRFTNLCMRVSVYMYV